MENQYRRRGIISKFASTYGFVKSKNPENPSIVDTYFVHLSNIEIFEPEYPREGDTCEFEISPLPAKPGKCRYAVHVHVYAKVLQNALGGVSALSGAIIGEPTAQPSGDSSRNDEPKAGV